MSENDIHNMDELLVKYMLDELSYEERRMVEAWVNANKANEKKIMHYSLLWQQSKELEQETNIDENEAWERFAKSIQKKPQLTPVVIIKKKNWWIARTAIAVALIGCITLLYFLLGINYAPENELVYLKSLDSTSTKTLSDGSTVTLNKQSSLTYNVNFSPAAREVVLTGEAFFNVTPNKLKPFIIKVNNVVVKVVGTSFNIKSTKEKVEIIVETGIVEVMYKQKIVTLHKNEKTIIIENSNTFSKEMANNKLYKYYKTKEFVCENTPLWELVIILNETYGSNIVIENNSLKSLPLSTTFHQESLDNTIDIISKTFGIKAIKTKNKIILNR